jgi:hypothetical protein
MMDYSIMIVEAFIGKVINEKVINYEFFAHNARRTTPA